MASARKVTEYVSSHVIRVPLRALSLPITLSYDGPRLVRWRLGGRVEVMMRLLLLEVGAFICVS
jgi:hypothetical protein